MSVAWQSDPKLVGQQIKKIRKQKHMTQDALAEELGGGCTNRTISQYETGKVEMGIQTLFDVAEALEVPVDKLVPDRLQVHMEEEEKSKRELLAIVGSLEQVAKHNPQLQAPSVETAERKQVLECYRQGGYQAVDDFYFKKYRMKVLTSDIGQVLPNSWKKKILQVVRSRK